MYTRVEKRRRQIFKNVLCGNFPEQAINEMSCNELEKFVLTLVQISTVKVIQDNGAKSITSFSLTKSKPVWWPTDKVFEKKLFSDDKTNFASCLRILISNCCQFLNSTHGNKSEQLLLIDKKLNKSGTQDSTITFINSNNPKSHWLTKIPNRLNKGKRKRKNDIVLDIIHNHKKKLPVVLLEDVLKPKVSKTSFLSVFGLVNKNCTVNKKMVPSIQKIFKKPIKLCSYPSIPFSSNVGRELLHRECHNFPEELQIRKLEKVEWFINKIPFKSSDKSYPVTYQEKDNAVPSHNYKFPRRQYKQHRGNNNNKMCLQKFCKPLKVCLKNYDLLLLKKKIKQTRSCGLIVKLNRIALPNISR